MTPQCWAPTGQTGCNLRNWGALGRMRLTQETTGETRSFALFYEQDHGSGIRAAFPDKYDLRCPLDSVGGAGWT